MPELNLNYTIMLTDTEKAYALALVHHHIKTDPEYYSWVLGYLKNGSSINGHWRMKAMCLRALRALKCTTKFLDET